MRHLLILSVGFLAWMIISESCPASRMISTDELEAKADLICNGTVLSNEESKPDKTTADSKQNLPINREIDMVAKIKILHVFKGDIPAEITFHYRALGGGNMLNPPERIRLQAGQRYRFFLKSVLQDGFYVNVLEGAVNDAFAVEKLAPKEPDDSAFLTRKQVEKIACDYFTTKTGKHLHAEAVCHVSAWPMNARCKQWFVSYAGRPSDAADSFLVIVNGDQSIDLEQTRIPLPSK